MPTILETRTSINEKIKAKVAKISSTGTSDDNIYHRSLDLERYYPIDIEEFGS